MNMLTLAAQVYTRLYFSRALRDCSQVCFQLNTLFFALQLFMDVSSSSFSHSPVLWEGVTRVLTEAYTIPHTAERKIERLKVFTTENLSLISLHHFTLSTSFLLTHSLTLSTIHFFPLLSFLNKSVILFFFYSSHLPQFSLSLFAPLHARSLFLWVSEELLDFWQRPIQFTARRKWKHLPLLSSPPALIPSVLPCSFSFFIYYLCFYYVLILNIYFSFTFFHFFLICLFLFLCILFYMRVYLINLYY